MVTEAPAAPSGTICWTLWLDVDSPESTDAKIRRRNRELVRQFEQTTSPIDEQVRVSNRTNVRCTKAAFKVAAAQYAPSR